LLDIYWNILTMHGPMNVKSPNNTSKWQIRFNSAFKGLKIPQCNLDFSCVVMCFYVMSRVKSLVVMTGNIMWFDIEKTPTMILNDMSLLCFSFSTHISFNIDVFVSIFPPIIVYRTCLSLCFLWLSPLWFVLYMLRTRGNHLTNRGYLINYQNGYLTEWQSSEGTEQG
jgi:hypothetical protein